MTTSSSDPGARATRLLTRGEVASLLDLDECIDAVQQAFDLHARGRSLPPGVLGVPCDDGGFHIKAAGLRLDRPWVAVKCNGNFFQNTERHGMPNIQGLILLFDGTNGYPVAVMDAIEITILRTGAATAVAARHLARPESKVVTVVGCGNQGRVQIRALAKVRPIRMVHALDINDARARRFADEMSAELGIESRASGDLSAALAQSDICVTCTPSRQAFVRREQIPDGMFLAAVGADSHDKQELEPMLTAASTLVTDITQQCAGIGELHHALAAGLMTRDQVHAELAEVVAGLKPGRTHADQVIVFDSTGTALQDVAAAVAVYRKAVGTGAGRSIDLLGASVTSTDFRQPPA